ncbi:sensor histidine kinase [Egicoccus sp. AB-alg2]|uniref:sensor histidine kinase n=1 Tax=Egicoccus sp. AB-alg2 TaxID=3242693 RepID=UPI00359D2943
MGTSTLVTAAEPAHRGSSWRRRATSPTVAALAGIAVLAWLVALALAWLDGTAELHRTVATGLGLVVPYVLVGALLAARVARNPLGWGFLAVGVLSALSNLATTWALRGLVTAPGSLPWAAEAAWLADLIWWPPLVVLVTWLVLLVPDGRLPSRAWRPVAWAPGLGLSLSVVVLAIATWPHRGDTYTGVGAGPLPPPAVAVAAAGAAIMVLSVPVCLAALLGRWRRTSGADRAQIGWFLVAAGSAVSGTAGIFVLPAPEYLVAAAGAAVLPVLTATAVLRHRLLGIEVIVRRSLVGGALTACLATMYVAVSASISLVVGRTSPLSTAVVAGVVAALVFEPARARVQRSVDRLIHGATAVDAATLASELQQARAALVTTREEERRRLRRDLHDGLGPSLAAIGVGLQAALAREPDGPVADVLRRNLAETERAMATVRGLVDGLRPPALDRLGLGEAVLEGVRPLLAGIELRSRIDLGGAPLPAAVEVAAYRIVLEAVTNVARHAGASHCELLLQQSDDGLHLAVRDDGGGPSGPSAGTGLGTATMRERAEELGGWCRIDLRADGTSVVAWLPSGASA